MKLKTYMLYVVSAMMLLAACNDMENVPTNKFTDNSYWTSEAKAQNVVNMAYSQMYDAGKISAMTKAKMIPWNSLSSFL